jgi:alpha-galactosidase
MNVDALVYLTASGCSVLVDLSAGRLPAIQHWGADLGRLTEEQARAISSAQQPVVGWNQVDVPIRLAVLPEHHTGWVGRPGLSGSRAGRSWSTKFNVRHASLDGSALGSYATAGPAVLTVVATDDEARLELTVTMQLLASGLLRCRAAVTNTAVEAFQIDDLVLAYPLPAQATELLDFAGRWGKERVPQRTPFDVGMRLREGRKGRTGADAATVLHAGTDGFGFGGVATTSTTPSGRSTAVGSSGAGSYCCQARYAWLRVRPTKARGSTARTAPDWTGPPDASTNTSGKPTRAWRSLDR